MSRKFVSLLFNIPLTLLILIYLILEELIWERVAEPVYKFIHGLKLLQKVEGSIRALNRYALLSIFLFLFVMVEILGIIALALFAEGQVLVGVVLYAAKIPIAAFTFWLFRIAQDKLLTFAWFKFCYGGLLTLIEKIKTSSVYISIKTKIHGVKIWLTNKWPRESIRRVKAFFGINTA